MGLVLEILADWKDNFQVLWPLGLLVHSFPLPLFSPKTPQPYSLWCIVELTKITATDSPSAELELERVTWPWPRKSCLPVRSTKHPCWPRFYYPDPEFLVSFQIKGLLGVAVKSWEKQDYFWNSHKILMPFELYCEHAVCVFLDQELLYNTNSKRHVPTYCFIN